MDNFADEKHEKILRSLWRQDKTDKAYTFFDFVALSTAIILAISLILGIASAIKFSN